MRRVMAVTAFLLMVLLPAMSQVRGGHAAGGFRGGAGNGVHGGRVGGAFRGGPVVRSQVVPRRGFGFSFGVGGFAGRPFFPRRHFFPYPYYYPYVYYPYTYAYPYYGVSIYDPGAYGVYGNYYSNYDSEAYAAQQQQQELNAQVNSLNQQVQDLREQNDNLQAYVERTDKYSRPAAPQPERQVPESMSQPVPRENPLTVLVFHDGHQTETRNYAVVGNTIWILSEKRSEKIPLADLDLEKTQQVNENRGVEFTIPQKK